MVGWLRLRVGCDLEGVGCCGVGACRFWLGLGLLSGLVPNCFGFWLPAGA